jgi:hypothetical protein
LVNPQVGSYFFYGEEALFPLFHGHRRCCRWAFQVSGRSAFKNSA